METQIRIGTIVATHGLDGTLLLKHELGKRTSFKGVEAFFIEQVKGSFLPFFPVVMTAKTDSETFISFDGITSREKAQLLLKKGVWLPEEMARSLASKNAPISMLGYHVIASGDDLGPVLEVIEQPLQILLRLEMQEKEVLIPLNESTLVHLDHKQRKVEVELPDGLLEVYLS